MKQLTNIAPEGVKPSANQLEYTPVKDGLRQRRSTGVWYLFQKISGKLYRDSLDTTDFKEAKQKRDAKVAEVKDAHAKGVDPKNKLSYGHFEDLYLANLAHLVELGPEHDDGVTDSTAETYRQGLERWRSLWGKVNVRELPIREITSERCDELLRPVRIEFAKTTFNRLYIPLNEIFKLAIEKKALLLNPLAYIKRSSKKTDKTYVPERDEWNAFLNFILTSPEYANSWKFKIVDFLNGLCATGLRKDEARNAKKEHVRFFRGADGLERGELQVVRSKTGAGVLRVVPLFPAAVAVIKNLIEKYPDTDALFPVQECNNTFKFVCGPKGLNLTRLVKRGGKSIEVPLRYSHHTCRHIFATTCLENGVEPKTAAEWLGHTSIVLFNETYAHVRRKFSQEQADKVTDVSFLGAEKPIRNRADELAALTVEFQRQAAALEDLKRKIDVAARGSNIVTLVQEKAA